MALLLGDLTFAEKIFFEISLHDMKIFFLSMDVLPTERRPSICFSQKSIKLVIS
jgi:hypothetical protein